MKIDIIPVRLPRRVSAGLNGHATESDSHNVEVMVGFGMLTGYYTRGKLARVDLPDLWRMLRYSKRWRWHYAGRERSHAYLEARGRVKLHRWLMQTPKGMHTDHINGDSTDNRRSNLRVCTPQQNSINRTNVKGVSWCAFTCKWRATIMLNGKQKTLGRFYNFDEARAAYDKAASELFGEFRRARSMPKKP